MKRSHVVVGAPVVTLALLLAGCGSADQRSVGKPVRTTVRPGAGPTTTAPAATTTTVGATALDQLAGFAAAARTLDGQLHAAATAINAAGPPWAFGDPSVGDAVTAADLAPVESALPAGLPAPLLQPAVLVFSDLVSRRAAMNDFAGPATSPEGVQSPAYPGPETQRHWLEGLGHGADAAAHFDADLAALEAAARATPPITPAAVDSRAAAETALLESFVHLANQGCDSRGGSRITSLPAIVWQPTVIPGGPRGDGTIDTIPFSATWTNGTWSVFINAC